MDIQIIVVVSLLVVLLVAVVAVPLFIKARAKKAKSIDVNKPIDIKPIEAQLKPSAPVESAPIIKPSISTPSVADTPIEKTVPAEAPQAEIPRAEIPQVETPQAENVVEQSVIQPEVTSLEKALSNTRKGIWGRISALFTGGELSGIDEIEEILYTSDLGPQTVEKLLESVKAVLKSSQKNDSSLVRNALKEEMLSILNQSQISQGQTLFEDFKFASTTPSVWMIVGVNGAGKTTTIGKMAAQLAQSGKKVLVAAGDTFRAAAGSQLKVWTERAQVEIFSPEGVTDPSAVAFDAVSMGKARGFDVIIIDTAGRLHTQQNLMEELKKMKRVIQKAIPEAPHEVLLVLDSNQGQNALQQAREYHKALEVTGVVLTKLDGTAKGGVAIGLSLEIKIPIKLIGVGEKINDLRPFSAKEFVESLF